MQKRINRLPRARSDAPHLHRTVARSGHLALRQGEGAPLTAPRVAIVVPKRLAKTAVLRNRLKRQLRAALAPLIKSLAPAPYLLLLTKRPERGAHAIFTAEIPRLFSERRRR